jgi:NADH-quinone oxidoreductase subunit H
VNALNAAWSALPPYVHSTVVTLILTVILILSVAYLTLWERKLIGWMPVASANHSRMSSSF